MLLLGAYKINAYICERLTNLSLVLSHDQGPPVSGPGFFSELKCFAPSALGMALLSHLKMYNYG